MTTPRSPFVTLWHATATASDQSISFRGWQHGPGPGPTDGQDVADAAQADPKPCRSGPHRHARRAKQITRLLPVSWRAYRDGLPEHWYDWLPIGQRPAKAAPVHASLPFTRFL